MNKLKISVILLTIATILAIGLFGLTIVTKNEAEQPILGCATLPPVADCVVLPEYSRPLDLPGRMIFEQNCRVCHRLDLKLVGPPLRNVFERRDSLWNVKMIKNAKKLRENGDSLAIQIFNEYNGTLHTNFESMPDSTLKDLITYLIEEGKRD